MSNEKENIRGEFYSKLIAKFGEFPFEKTDTWALLDFTASYVLSYHDSKFGGDGDALSIDELMSEFKRNGIDPSDWDGEEGAEAAIVCGIIKHYEDGKIAQLEADKAELVKHLSIMTDLTVAYANRLNISGDYIDQVFHSRQAIQKHAAK